MGEREPATEHGATFHRHGDPDPSKWDEQEAVTDRPPDTPQRGEDKYAVPNTTLADRAKARKQDTKRVAEAENKAVTPAQTASKSSKSAKKSR